MGNRHRHAWQVVSLLYDDGRESRFPGGSLGCDPSSCRYCTTLQLEVLAACATLRRMCAEGPVWRVAVLEALRAAPRALDTVLALLSSCPFVGPQAEDDAGEPDPAHPARRWERLAKPVVCASRHLRRNEAPDGYAATPELVKLAPGEAPGKAAVP